MAGFSFAFIAMSWTSVSKWRVILSLDQLTSVNWQILGITGLAASDFICFEKEVLLKISWNFLRIFIK